MMRELGDDVNFLLSGPRNSVKTQQSHRHVTGRKYRVLTLGFSLCPKHWRRLVTYHGPFLAPYSPVLGSAPTVLLESSHWLQNASSHYSEGLIRSLCGSKEISLYVKTEHGLW